MISVRSVAWLFDPPDHLPDLRGRAVSAIRRLWIAAMIAAILVQLAATSHAVYDAYRITPVLRSIGLATTFDEDDRLAVTPLTRQAKAAGITPDMAFLAIGSTRFAPNVTRHAVVRAIDALPGADIAMRLRRPDGTMLATHLTRSPAVRSEAEAQNPIPSELRMTIRLGFGLLSSLSLLGSATLLFLKRSRDPEAMLIASAFVAMALTTQEPIFMWLSFGLGWFVNLATYLWWPPIVIAIAAFPDGRFDPRWTRWTVPVALVAGIALSTDLLIDLPALVLGAGLPVLLLAMQLVRYRKLKTGIERQQLKWAGFGFAIGFTLLAISLAAITFFQAENWSPMARSIYTLAALCVFSLAFAILPLGLMISLLRFRLWEVDTVISRSAAYAFTTTLVGVVWAGTSDLVKSFITNLLGEENIALSVVCSALLAATVFAPTQAIALSWSKQRLNRKAFRIEALPKRMRIWREELEPAEFGMRTLAVLVEGVHAECGAILMRTPVGRETIAAVNLAEPAALADLSHGELAGDARITRLVTLADDDGPVGWLALGRRDDGNRYSRDQLEAIDSLVMPLAEGLRIAAANAARTSGGRRGGATGGIVSQDWDGQPRTA